MICKNCGVDCDPEQLFCLRCGTPLDFSSGDTKNEVEADEEIELMEDNTATINLNEDDIDLLINMDIAERNRPKRSYSESEQMKKKNAYDQDNISHKKNIDLERKKTTKKITM
ncbi:MAG: zinc ribbon domain-containing protein, partial [Lachnospiraceae bacterium]|nr:zinc ribbon domain-containing protein [Lachnospiraceae bacterium]